ncbi:MAG: Uncharacterised protein [Owenweeksia sp. TMED14]|nr:MAG: Uncharacterised protein [Owenweeksia sp. TMED14]
MISQLLYIGPGLGIGSVILVFLIGAIVLFSLGYIVYLKAKRFLKK